MGQWINIRVTCRQAEWDRKQPVNREGEPRYIVDLIGHVITVSLRTVAIVENLPAL